MASTEVVKYPKPQMRGLFRSFVTRHLITAGVLAIIGGLAWKYGVGERRKQRYAEFYKDYDAIAEFEKMRKAGVFKCFPADE